MLIPTLVLATLFGLAQAGVFTIIVGMDEVSGLPGRGFFPSVIFPDAGDTVTFTFQLPSWIKNPPVYNHSATESTFDYPCTPGGQGFDTGIQQGGGASFDFIVNNTNSRWFFSSAEGDCKYGMVFAINPNVTGTTTAKAFQDRARSSPGSDPEPLSSWSLSPDSTPPPIQEPAVSATVTGSARPNATRPSSFSGATTVVLDVSQTKLMFAGLLALIGIALVA